MSKYKYTASILLVLLVSGRVAAQKLDTGFCTVIQYAALKKWNTVRKAADEYHMKPANLNKQEIARIFGACRKYVAYYNIHIDTSNWGKLRKQQSTFDPYQYKVNPNLRYFMQMVPLMQTNGDKVVFVICVCDEAYAYNLRTELLEAVDMGTCHLGFKMNLTTGDVYDKWVD